MAKNIIFVEDEAAMQRAVSEFLTVAGYNVTSALDGESGLEMILEKKPDLVLLDLILPRKNGFDVLKAIKADASTKDIPVIVLTNLSGMDDIGKVLEFGGTNYLVKSDQSLQDILDMVNKTLGAQ